MVRTPLRQTPRNGLEEVLAANFLGAFFALKHARLNPGAEALFLGVYPAYVEVPGFTAYAASKQALESLLNTARKEWRREGVGLVLVRLPAVDTPLWGALAPEEAARRILAGLEGGRGIGAVIPFDADAFALGQQWKRVCWLTLRP